MSYKEAAALGMPRASLFCRFGVPGALGPSYYSVTWIRTGGSKFEFVRICWSNFELAEGLCIPPVEVSLCPLEPLLHLGSRQDGLFFQLLAPRIVL